MLQWKLQEYSQMKKWEREYCHGRLWAKDEKEKVVRDTVCCFGLIENITEVNVSCTLSTLFLLS